MMWLGLFAKDFYNKAMSPILTLKFNWPAVIAFYLLYLIGVFVFAIMPGIEAKSLQKTVILAAAFGFFCYMTYDLTNLATVKDWPIKLALIDIIWGTTLSAFSALIAYKIYFWIA